MRFPSSGRFRDLVTIQKKSSTQGAYGEETTWTDIHNRPCEIFPIDGKESYSADAEHNTVRYRITFRWEPNLIRSKYRLIDKAYSPWRYFDVEAVLNARNESNALICKCVERF